MIPQRFAEYLQEVLALPAAVYESPSFSYSDLLETSIFSAVSDKYKNYQIKREEILLEIRC
jgi:hypothetical protein